MKAINEIFEYLARSENPFEDKTKIKSILNESPDHKYKITEFRQCEDLDNFIYELKQKGWVKAGPMFLRHGSFKHVMIVDRQALENIEISIYTDDKHVIDLLGDFEHLLRPFKEPKTKEEILASMNEPWGWRRERAGRIHINGLKGLLIPIRPLRDGIDRDPDTWIWGEVEDGLMILLDVMNLYSVGGDLYISVSILSKQAQELAHIRQKVLSVFSCIEVVEPNSIRAMPDSHLSYYYGVMQEAVQVIKKTTLVQTPPEKSSLPSLTPPEKVKTQDVRRTIIANWLSKLTKKD